MVDVVGAVRLAGSLPAARRRPHRRRGAPRRRGVATCRPRSDQPCRPGHGRHAGHRAGACGARSRRPRRRPGGWSARAGAARQPLFCDGRAARRAPRVGPVTAQKIVDWRTAHGPFRSVDALDDVPGIGPARLDQLRDLVTPVMRRLVAYGWPTLLVGAACAGLAMSNWLRPGSPMCAVAIAVAVLAGSLVEGHHRLALAALVLGFAALWWGGARLQALGQSVLVSRIGERADALVVVTGPASRGRYSLRLPVVVRRFAGAPMRESVLLELPGKRAPPQGALLELRARPVAPRGPETGFDERHWLAQQGIHVVLEGRDPRIVGRRGGIGGVADRLRRHVGSALARGASGEQLAAPRRRRARGCRGSSTRPEGGFQGLGSLPPAGRQRSKRRVHRLGRARSRVAARAFPARLPTLGVLVAIAAYTLAVGWQPSVVRAAVAGSLGSLAWLASRPQDRWHFLALGALVLLAWNPATLFDPAFSSRSPRSPPSSSGCRGSTAGSSCCRSRSGCRRTLRGVHRRLDRLRHRDEPDPLARLPPGASVDGRRERTRRAGRRAAARPRALRRRRRPGAPVRGGRARLARRLGGGVDRVLRAGSSRASPVRRPRHAVCSSVLRRVGVLGRRASPGCRAGAGGWR